VNLNSDFCPLRRAIFNSQYPFLKSVYPCASVLQCSLFYCYVIYHLFFHIKLFTFNIRSHTSSTFTTNTSFMESIVILLFCFSTTASAIRACVFTITYYPSTQCNPHCGLLLSLSGNSAASTNSSHCIHNNILFRLGNGRSQYVDRIVEVELRMRVVDLFFYTSNRVLCRIQPIL